MTRIARSPASPRDPQDPDGFRSPYMDPDAIAALRNHTFVSQSGETLIIRAVSRETPVERTAVMPACTETVVMQAVRDYLPQPTRAPADRCSCADPVDIEFPGRRRGRVLSLKFLLPKRIRTYRGGALWTPAQPTVHASAACVAATAPGSDPNAATPSVLRIMQRDVMNALRGLPAGVDAAEAMRQADALARANDERMESFGGGVGRKALADYAEWKRRYDAQVQATEAECARRENALALDFEAIQGAIAERRRHEAADALAMELKRRVAASEVTGEPVSYQTLVANMVGTPAETFHRDLNALLAADGLVSA